jgi:hypothetical protein
LVNDIAAGDRKIANRFFSVSKNQISHTGQYYFNFRPVPLYNLACIPLHHHDNESLVALIEKYLVNNIQCIAEKIAAEMRTSLLAHHVAEFPAKKTTTTKRNANIAGCVSCRSAGSRNQRLNQTADLDCELSGAMADFGVVLNSSDSTAPEFGLWRVGRTELADYSLDRTSSRLPVTWSAMKTSTHSCSAACSRQNGRQQSRLYMKNQ